MRKRNLKYSKRQQYGPDADAEACRRLWAEVLLRAYWVLKGPVNPAYAAEAVDIKKWMYSADFDLVAGYAGLDETATRERFEEALSDFERRAENPLLGRVRSYYPRHCVIVRSKQC